MSLISVEHLFFFHCYATRFSLKPPQWIPIGSSSKIIQALSNTRIILVMLSKRNSERGFDLLKAPWLLTSRLTRQIFQMQIYWTRQEAWSRGFTAISGWLPWYNLGDDKASGWRRSAQVRVLIWSEWRQITFTSFYDLAKRISGESLLFL